MEERMYRRLVGAMYVINIIAQAIFTLITPAAILFGIAFLLVKYLSLPSFLYAIAIILGVLVGFISMIRFVIAASEALERLEKQQNNSKAENDINEE